jgi:CheY-like chemotaxis protein
MIVDDDKVDRWILKKSFEKIRLAKEIIESSTGVEALELITNSSITAQKLPELIFLDVNMPVLNGFGFLDAFDKLSREYKNRCRIAVISSFENESDRQRALSYESVIGYFEKPLKEETILLLKEKLRFTKAS